MVQGHETLFVLRFFQRDMRNRPAFHDHEPRTYSFHQYFNSFIAELSGQNTIRGNRNWAVARINKLRSEAIPNIECRMPNGAFYLFPYVGSYFGKGSGGRKIGDSSELAGYLLEEAHTATVSGEPFGASIASTPPPVEPNFSSVWTCRL